MGEKAGHSATIRVLVRAEWIEEIPAAAVAEPGGSLSVSGRDLVVWMAGAPQRHQRPYCDVDLRAAEAGLLAGWQRAAIESARRGTSLPAKRYPSAAPVPSTSWGLSVHLVAHLSGDRRLEPVERALRGVSLGRALDAVAEVAEEVAERWRGGTFGVTGRVILTADGREQLRAEITREQDDPADVLGVLEALEAVTVAAERLYEGMPPEDTAGWEAEASAPRAASDAPGAHDDDGEDDKDMDTEPGTDDYGTTTFRYRLDGDGVPDDHIERDSPLLPGAFVETSVGTIVVEHIGPPEADGVRPAAARRLHPTD